MACFLAPAAEAIVVTAIKHHCKKEEKMISQEKETVAVNQNSVLHTEFTETKKIPMSRKIGWLTNLLWGGSFLLAIEHIWHGEVVPWFPFLTAMYNPADIQPMLMEIASVGVSMAVLITAVWAIMMLAVSIFEKKEASSPAAQEKAGV